MLRTAIASTLAAFAAADINEDFGDLLQGREDLHATHFEPIWAQYKAEFEGQSPVDLDEDAMFNFFENVDKIITHNKQEDKKFSQGINAFSAMTFEQFAEHFHLKDNQENAPQNCSATGRASPLTTAGNDDVPDSWDWSKHGGVSPVKDQGNCGSCWTFSTVGCLESAHLIGFGRLETYAEQQLVDCAGDFDNFGCDGGLPSHAFEYVHFNGGITTEAAYPYKGVDQTCTVDSSTYKLSVGHAMNITEGDEVELKAAVFKQPVSVAFDCEDDFMNYSSGVYSSTNCKNGPADVNHAVLAVGYGTDETTGMDFWYVKNSWSTTWGDKGFFKIERGVNMCGIAQCNSYPESVDEINGGIQFWSN